MGLKIGYEPKIYGLHPNIISLGSFERDGSYPYVYNNEQAAIILEDLDTNFKCIINNNITAFKKVQYKGQFYTVPVVTNQIEYTILNDIAKNNNAKLSILNVMQIYKAIATGLDINGMLLFGFRYDQDPEKDYKFKTIGLRGIYGNNNNQYGVFLWGEALQYNKLDSDGNESEDGEVTITSLTKTTKSFYTYDYSLEYLTMMTTFEYDSTNNQLNIEYASVEKQPTGERLIDLQLALNCDSDNADFDPSKIFKFITMPELHNKMDYSYYHIKTFGDKLDFSTLEHQSNIIVAL